MKLNEVVANQRVVNLRDLASDSVLTGNIQSILAQLGCLDPPVDGDFGPVSLLALKSFAAKSNIDFEDSISVELSEALLRSSADNFIPLILVDELASRIIRYMLLRGFWFARLPGFLTIVYLEGLDQHGEPNNNTFNEFNDRRIVLEFTDGRPSIRFNALATTEPGSFYTQNPLNPLGVARIAFGQYKSWRVGVHKAGKPGAHEALVQVADVAVHRDLNEDGKRVGDKVHVGSGFGINQHSGHNVPANNIGKASAGCLVGRTDELHREFIALVKTDPRYAVASRGYTYMTTILDGRDMLERVV